MKRRIPTAASILLVVAAIAAPVGYAAMTYTGQSGLLLAPSADTLAERYVAIGCARLNLASAISVGIGLAPNLEIGVGSIDPGHGPSVYPLLKLRLAGESRGMPALAVGLEGQALYVAASKRLADRGPRVHVGFGSGRFDGLFAGIEHVVNPVSISARDGAAFPTTTLVGECVGGDFNVGAKFDFAGGFGLNIGLLDMDTLSAGVSFRTKF